MRRLTAAAVFLLFALTANAAPRRHAAATPSDPPPQLWLATHAIPLRTVEPSTNDNDLAAVLPLIGDARVVALGDATHGTHEFFALKQRLVPYLIEHAGFRTVAFEAPYEFEKLDTYVKGGAGDPAAALEIADYFFWGSQEVLDLVEWIRAWNAAGNPAVSITGIDAVHPNAATDAVVSYLSKIDAAAATFASNQYACLNEYWTQNSFYKEPEDAHNACRATVFAVRPSLESHRDAYERATSHDAFEVALHAARVAEQAFESFATQRLNRDQSLGENIVWNAARAKTIVLGHMAHFGRLTYTFVDPAGIKPAGAYASESLGRDYVTIASATYTGRVNSYFKLLGSAQPFTVVVADIPPPPSTDVTQIFARANAPQTMIVPLRNAPSWLAGTQRWRIAGTVTSSMFDPTTSITGNLAAGYDAIIYVESTAATKLLWSPTF